MHDALRCVSVKQQIAKQQNHASIHNEIAQN
jgi:hypothetical protein